MGHDTELCCVPKPPEIGGISRRDITGRASCLVKRRRAPANPASDSAGRSSPATLPSVFAWGFIAQFCATLRGMSLAELAFPGELGSTRTNSPLGDAALAEAMRKASSSSRPKMDERNFYTESQITKNLTLVCP